MGGRREEGRRGRRIPGMGSTASRGHERVRTGECVLGRGPGSNPVAFARSRRDPDPNPRPRPWPSQEEGGGGVRAPHVPCTQHAPLPPCSSTAGRWQMGWERAQARSSEGRAPLSPPPALPPRGSLWGGPRLLLAARKAASSALFGAKMPAGAKLRAEESKPWPCCSAYGALMSLTVFPCLSPPRRRASWGSPSPHTLGLQHKTRGAM